MAKVIYPKKRPGFTNVRSSSRVNNGMLNNLLFRVNYPAAIGTLTGKIEKGRVESIEYVWYQVQTAKGLGWVREDGFSYVKNNAETQADPKKERLRVAQDQARTTLAKVQATGKKLQTLSLRYAQLNPQAQKALDTVARSYAASVKKLQGVGAIQVKTSKGVSGLGVLPAIPVVYGLYLAGAAVVGFLIDRWMKWYGDMKVIEGEQDQQQKAMDLIGQNLQSSDATTRAQAQKALEEIAKNSEATQQKQIEASASSDIVSSAKQIALIGVAAFAGLKLFEVMQAKK